VSASMIENARQQHAGMDSKFFAGEECTQGADYTIASGIFNVRGEYSDSDWLTYCLDTVRKISALSAKGMSFNMLTKYSDAEKMRGYLYYADPCAVFDFCKRELSRNVALLHDYGLYEFTILVRK
jgi:hypothetical protein